MDKEGMEIDKNSLKLVSVDEQYTLNLDLRRQLGIESSKIVLVKQIWFTNFV
jgi:hypothetical protein